MMEYVWPAGMSGDIRHNTAIMNAALLLSAKFAGTGCRVFVQGTRYYYTGDKYLEPDVLVRCKETTEYKTGFTGLLHLVIEVLSPSTKHHDLNQKKDIYAKCGVDEYWAINTRLKCVTVSVLREGVYVDASYLSGAFIRLQHWPDVTIQVDDIFKEDL